MKTLIVGNGGIGSYLVEFIASDRSKGQYNMSDFDFTLCDFDLVEKKNILYQNFSVSDLNENKAYVLANKFKGFKVRKNKISKDNDLKDFDVIVCAVDNFPTRKLVANHCHKHNKRFVDIRSFGKKCMAFSESLPLNEYIGTLDLDDKESGSCQRREDLDKSIIQKGYHVAASVGAQLILNVFRGVKNPPQIIISM